MLKTEHEKLKKEENEKCPKQRDVLGLGKRDAGWIGPVAISEKPDTGVLGGLLMGLDFV